MKHREYHAATPVPIKIGDQDYELLFTFGRIKRIRETLKVDLLSTSEVGLDIFTKVLLAGLVDPKELTEEKLDDLISVPQLHYYIEALQLAITGQIQPSDETKNASPASSPTGSGKKKARKKRNSISGAGPLVNGESRTPASGS